MNYFYLGRLLLAVSAILIAALFVGFIDFLRKITNWAHKHRITGKHALNGVK